MDIQKINSKLCKVCDGIGHTAFYCPFKPRKTLKTYKPMNKVGKQARRTEKAVRQWKSKQSPNHQGFYQCYICNRWIEYLMAEHVKSKVRHPDKRTDQSNLRPTCASCNEKKGSKDLD